MNAVYNYMALAEECLNEANVLYQNRLFRGTCGRAYYAYFDAVRALLATKNIVTKSHSAARGLFSEHFIKDGPFSKKDATWLNELFQLRQTGEYEADEDLSEEDASKALEIATEFILQVEAYLHTTGL
jgi:uncharacterized protein (UPF0332 family)